MSQLVKMKLSDLVLDFDMYLRGDINHQNVTYMKEAQEAGAEFPPILVDKKTKKVVDGFARYTKDKQLYGLDCEVECEVRSFKNEGEMAREAMIINSKHGNRLTKQDYVRCILIGEERGLTLKQISFALNISLAGLKNLKTGRICPIPSISPTGQSIPIKQTIKHMAGKVLNKEQVRANDKLSGMNQNFYVRQVIILIDSDLLNLEDERLMSDLEELYEKLTGVLSKESICSRG